MSYPEFVKAMNEQRLKDGPIESEPLDIFILKLQEKVVTLRIAFSTQGQKGVLRECTRMANLLADFAALHSCLPEDKSTEKEEESRRAEGHCFSCGKSALRQNDIYYRDRMYCSSCGRTQPTAPEGTKKESTGETKERCFNCGKKYFVNMLSAFGVSRKYCTGCAGLHPDFSIQPKAPPPEETKKQPPSGPIEKLKSIDVFDTQSKINEIILTVNTLTILMKEIGVEPRYD